MNHGVVEDALTLEELDAESVRFDTVVAATPAIDRFCSSSLWVLPAARHLLPPIEPWVRRTPETYLAFARSRQPNGARVLHPLEAMWALPSPVLGADPSRSARHFADALASDDEWDAAVVTGIEDGSPSWRALSSALVPRYALSRGPSTKRHIADLTGGVEGFLSRRSRGFRENLSKSVRRASRRGIGYEVADALGEDAIHASFQRLLRIERRSWKGAEGVGIDTEPMASFYLDMLARLAARGALRLVFARLGGEDVGYILGGLSGTTYRGLQFSFDDRYRQLSLGNLLQLTEIERLVADGIEAYDLGTDVEYKKRWGDRVFETTSLFVYSYSK